MTRLMKPYFGGSWANRTCSSQVTSITWTFVRKRAQWMLVTCCQPESNHWSLSACKLISNPYHRTPIQFVYYNLSRRMLWVPASKTLLKSTQATFTAPLISQKMARKISNSKYYCRSFLETWGIYSPFAWDFFVCCSFILFSLF